MKIYAITINIADAVTYYIAAENETDACEKVWGQYDLADINTTPHIKSIEELK